MKPIVISLLKIFIYILTSTVMWGVLYLKLNSNEGVFTHSVLSGVLLIAPILVLNFILFGMFVQIMREQNQATNN